MSGARSIAVHGLRSIVAAPVEPIPTRSGPLAVTISVGAAGSGAADEDVPALLARADSALYDAKRAGRDRVRLAPRP